MKTRITIKVLALVCLILLTACNKKESNSITQGPFISFDTMVDSRDNHIYKTIKIGDQIWMAENLAYLPAVYPSDSGLSTAPYYYVYDYQGTDVNAAKSTNNYLIYGVLYNWPATMNGESSSNTVPSGVQGICPIGWHLPSDEEWKILEGEVDSQYGYPDSEWDGTRWRGTDAGRNLKETGTTHWNPPNTGATNFSGFTALPGGCRDAKSFYLLENRAYFWSSTDNNSSFVWNHNLLYNNTAVFRNIYDKEDGFSVRCTKD